MFFVILAEGLLAFSAFRLALPDDIRMWKGWKRLESHYTFFSAFLIVTYLAYCVSQII